MNHNKTTLVIGASSNPSRYSYKAIFALIKYNIPVFAIGKVESVVGNIDILSGFPALTNIHTVTIYLNKDNQSIYYDYILNIIKPVRIIFNPGAENYVLKKLAEEKNIDVVEDCTLVMLSIEEY